MDTILYWNFVAIQAGAYDYNNALTAVPDQSGPLQTSRAFAIIHGAMYDTLAVFDPGLNPVFNVNQFFKKPLESVPRSDSHSELNFRNTQYF